MFSFLFQFSNHTGYDKGVRGQVLDDQQLSELIEGLKMNNLDVYSHMINGYIGSDKFLKQLKSTVIDMKKKNPDLVFVCDPVMGDMGPGKAIYIRFADMTHLQCLSKNILDVLVVYEVKWGYFEQK